MIPAAEAILRLLYPEDCGLCRTPLSLEFRHLCADCACAVRDLRRHPADMLETDLSGQLDAAWVLYPFRGPVRKLLHEVKFHQAGHLILAFQRDFLDFALLIAGERTYDAVVPVPSDLERLLDRQMNPAEEMAALTAAALKVPLKTRWLRRRNGTGSQRTRSERERKVRLQGVFRSRFSARPAGKRILLVDDIRTTGATAAEAALTLRDLGAVSVDLLALAQTERKQPPERTGK